MPPHRFADAVAYSAESAYYRCITPPTQYMLIRPFEGDMCRRDFIVRLAHFVNRSLPRHSEPRVHVQGCAESSEVERIEAQFHADVEG